MQGGSSSTLPSKPRSSLSRRPQSGYKNAETAHSITSCSSGSNEQQARDTVISVFNHSKKLQKFLEDKHLDQGQALSTLIDNELFTLSLIPVMQNQNGEEVAKAIERICIHKLDRIIQMEAQKNICEEI